MARATAVAMVLRVGGGGKAEQAAAEAAAEEAAEEAAVAVEVVGEVAVRAPPRP
jgi:hypothetical protein